MDTLKEIRKTVKRIYREFGTTDPFRICRQKGIIVMYAPLGSLNAHYTKIYRIPAIVINSELEEVEATIACLHELGHLFLVLYPSKNTSIQSGGNLVYFMKKQ